jgi:hypothetical protein
MKNHQTMHLCFGYLFVYMKTLIKSFPKTKTYILYLFPLKKLKSTWERNYNHNTLCNYNISNTWVVITI